MMMLLPGFIESFNGRLRDEYLNEHLFTNLIEAAGSSKHGGSTTTPSGHTRASKGSHQRSLLHAPQRGITRTDSPYERRQYGGTHHHVCSLTEVNNFGCQFVIDPLNFDGIAEVTRGGPCTTSLHCQVAFGTRVLDRVASFGGGSGAGSFSPYFALCLADSWAAHRFLRSIKVSVRRRLQLQSPRSSGHAGHLPHSRAKRFSTG